MNFNWKLTNTNHLSDEHMSQIELGIERQAYACQRRIQEQFNVENPQASVGDSVNVIMDAVDEAYVVSVNVDDEDVTFELDFSEVIVNYEIN